MTEMTSHKLSAFVSLFCYYYCVFCLYCTTTSELELLEVNRS